MLFRSGAAIGGENDLVALPGTHEAEALLAVAQFAVARAEVALQAAVVQLMPVSGRDNGFAIDKCTFLHDRPLGIVRAYHYI